MQYILVYITARDKAEAEAIASAALDKGLAACANIPGPVHSMYKWEGNLESGPETVLLLKSRRDLFPALREEVRRLHSYATPCIVSLPLLDGDRDFLDWIDASCTAKPSGD
ncbi:MAG: divalent-cation tolerance protein CutA [Deltaproteobacteria bacterium]|nr:divalent-cation tolerance protein CutA [Deltaproteobacteria bacterium]